jgi:amidase
MAQTQESLAASQSDADPVGAFIPGARVHRNGAPVGPLAGLRFAVKDLFDVAGAATTFGNPDWARTHPVAGSTAPIVSTLIESGATIVGKTKTVELAYGLTGENIWHGTPINPAAPERFPGGSSCGSAAAVGASLVDFALGSDTGGSVRIPASYCGLFGIRPSQGAISLAGVCPLAPSLDTPGWFTRSAGLLEKIGALLLPGGGEARALGPLLAVQEAWNNALPEVAVDLRRALARLDGVCGRAASIAVVPEGLAELYGHFRAVQAAEAWTALGDWVSATVPRLSPAVTERLAMARDLDPALAAAGRVARQAMQARLRPLLAGGAVLVYPTSPAPAPLLTSTPAEQNAVREATICVTAIGGFAGLPEVTLPVANVAGGPVGLSLVAGFGRDRALLAFAKDAAAALGLPA